VTRLTGPEAFRHSLDPGEADAVTNQRSHGPPEPCSNRSAALVTTVGPTLAPTTRRLRTHAKPGEVLNVPYFRFRH
jgi:hypothetical protein